MSNYAAPERLDPKLLTRANLIVEWIVKHDSRDPEMRAHMEAMEITRDDIETIFHKLGNDGGSGTEAGTLPVAF